MILLILSRRREFACVRWVYEISVVVGFGLGIGIGLLENAEAEGWEKMW